MGAKMGIPRATNQREKHHSRLYTLRIEKKMSQRELAVHAGVSRNTVMQIENGDVIPNMDTMMKLCDALGVSIEKLIGK